MTMLLTRIISEKVESLKICCIQTVDNAVERAFRGSMLSLIMITLMWIAVFLYVVFYYCYVPAPSYLRPIHLQVEACEKTDRSCPFPSAHVRLTKRNQLLKMGQPYKFSALLEMPESPVNKELGMFMVCIQLKDKRGFLIWHSCRSNMLHYRSDFLHRAKIFIFSPMFIFGNKEEKQVLNFELFSDFEEDQNHPVTDVYIEVQSHNIEIYTATLHINAILGGLSYFMYYWPITSSLLGIAFNLFVVFFTVSLSFYHKFFVETVPVKLLKSCLKKLDQEYSPNLDRRISLATISEDGSEDDFKSPLVATEEIPQTPDKNLAVMKMIYGSINSDESDSSPISDLSSKSVK